MKQVITLLLSILAIFITNIPTAIAQDNYEDVIYLKSGTVFRGIIVEQIPDKYYKLKMADGNIFEFETQLVARVTREPKGTSNATPQTQRTGSPATGELIQPGQTSWVSPTKDSDWPAYFVSGFLTLHGSLPYIVTYSNRSNDNESRLGYQYGPDVCAGLRLGKATYIVGMLGYHWGESYSITNEISSNDADYKFAAGLAFPMGKMLIATTIGQVYINREYEINDPFSGRKTFTQSVHSLMITGFSQIKLSDELTAMVGTDLYFLDNAAYLSLRLGIGVSTLFFQRAR